MDGAAEVELLFLLAFEVFYTFPEFSFGFGVFNPFSYSASQPECSSTQQTTISFDSQCRTARDENKFVGFRRMQAKSVIGSQRDCEMRVACSKCLTGEKIVNKDLSETDVVWRGVVCWVAGSCMRGGGELYAR